MDVRELLLQMQRDDSERAFNALFRLEYDRLFRIAVYFLQNDELAKEAALDALATLWERRHTMVVPDDFRRFSFTIVKNKALNLIRKEARYTELPADGNRSAGFEDLLEQEEIFEAYNNLVDSLPERCREVFCCVKEQGMSYAETAARLHVSTKTVDAQLQKALRTLRDGLEKFVDKKQGRRFVMIFL